MRFGGLYIAPRFYLAGGLIAASFVVAFYLPIVLPLSFVALAVWILGTFVDLLELFTKKVPLTGSRKVPEKLSNGDQNVIECTFHNQSSISLQLEVIDELPEQFQIRDFIIRQQLNPQATRVSRYELRPVKRGEYHFGRLLAFCSTRLGLLQRRIVLAQPQMVKVYPAFLLMRKYELLAISNKLTEVGIKRIRRVGQTREFDLIRSYVAGDDIRTINWKATARRSELMVNHYQDERSQQVYCIIDKSRVMQMPFGGMTLLDYSINASLVLSKIALIKFDRAGILTFQDRPETLIPASRLNRQMGLIMEGLYGQKTGFRESDFARLYARIRTKISQRSLLVIFTNFESHYSLERQLPYLKAMASQHVVVVVFFENTELTKEIYRPAKGVEDVYFKTIAQTLHYEKREIVSELNLNGIFTVLTSPERLTADTINKYLEIKARQIL